MYMYKTFLLNISYKNILYFDCFNQIRFSTKRVTGSTKNKRNSAGRRLGTKKNEAQFVKPNEIIIRQRGTKIHPGENTGIGKDHTIYALEPGYVRFYYNPFHPKRKYVGLSLKKNTMLPTPHFEPRLRRFGYDVIIDKNEALKEEESCSKKEYDSQDFLNNIKNEKMKFKNDKINDFLISIKKNFSLDNGEDDLKTLMNRTFYVYQLTKLGVSIEDARLQSTYNFFYDLMLKLNQNLIQKNEFVETKKKFLILTSKFENTVGINFLGNLCKYLTPQQREKKRFEILNILHEKYYNKVTSTDEKKKIHDMIYSSNVFLLNEVKDLKKKYLLDTTS